MNKFNALIIMIALVGSLSLPIYIMDTSSNDFIELNVTNGAIYEKYELGGNKSMNKIYPNEIRKIVIKVDNISSIRNYERIS